MIEKLLMALVLTFPSWVWAQKVVFINPGKSDEAYWVAASSAMQMAAHSLNMQLEVRYTERQHLQSIDIARELAARAPDQQPEYVIFSNDYGVSLALLDIFKNTGIRTFMAFSSPTDVERKKTGVPRQIYPHWLGSLEPRAQDAGYLTATALIRKARAMKATGPDQKLHMLAIAGDRSTRSSILRNEGMQRAVAESPDVVLDQLVYADWSQAKAAEQSEWLLARYPHAKLIWGGNDLIAFGAMESVEKRGGIPGQTVFFSGINTSTAALEAVQNGRLTALAGGHFITGAWAMVMLYDHAHGRDFASEGYDLTVPMFSLLTPPKIKTFLNRFGEPPKPIDFRQYSKVYNPKIKRYGFGFEQLLK